MAAPPAYLDECVDRPVIDNLRERGFDVLTAVEAGRGEDPDGAQLEFASAQGRVLFTYNRADFRRLHAFYQRSRQPHGGIIAIPQNPPVRRRQLRAALMLDWLGTLDRYESGLFQWNDLQRLLLADCRLDGYTEQEIREAVGHA